MRIEESEGYLKLLKAILDDTMSGRTEAERLKKLEFAVNRAKHYEDKIGIEASEILTNRENNRDYWYMNYYQDCNQPILEGEGVRVFETLNDLVESIEGKGFRCPRCNGVSTNPYSCDSGMKLSGEPEVCNWKIFGLLFLGGTFAFVKDVAKGEKIFVPVAWEK